MASIINSTTTNGVTVQGDNSGSLQLATNNGTTAVTIDTSQNVGIGTTSPATRLDVRCVSDVTQDIAYFSRPDAAVRAKIALDGSGIINFGTSTNHPLAFLTNNTEQARITSAGLLQFNSGYGSVATAYGCRAWVNFDGTGTVAIRASGNVTSITDNGTGDYTANFTNAMPDANYAVAGIAMFQSSVNNHFIGLGDANGAGGTLPSTTAVRFRTMYNDATNTSQDCTYITLMVIR